MSCREKINTVPALLCTSWRWSHVFGLCYKHVCAISGQVAWNTSISKAPVSVMGEARRDGSSHRAGRRRDEEEEEEETEKLSQHHKRLYLFLVLFHSSRSGATRASVTLICTTTANTRIAKTGREKGKLTRKGGRGRGRVSFVSHQSSHRRVHAGPAVVNMHQRRVPGYVKAPAQRLVPVAVHLPHVYLASKAGRRGARQETLKEKNKLREKTENPP